jgi:tetratricopeptide (TPR) repeat protein
MQGQPQSDLDMLHQANADAATPGGRFFALLSRAFSELNRGRPAAAARTLTEASRIGPEHAGDVYGFGISTLFADADSADFASRRARVDSFTSGPEPADSTAMTTYRHARCSLELWRVTNGRLDTAERTVAQLRAWTAATPHDGTTRPCADAIQAMYSSQIDAPDAEAAAMRLDSVLLHTYVEPSWHGYYAIMSGRVWQQLGDLERARAALNRYVRDQRYGRAPLLLEKARVEAALGYRDEATATYRQYLRLRPDPEPGRASDLVTEARAELARLIGETRS